MLLFAAPAVAAPATLADRPEVQAFARDMEERHQLPAAQTLRLLRQAVLQKSALKAIAPPADPQRRSWVEYRALFVNPERISGGLAFWQRQAADLARAHAEYGVPVEIIIAIIGIETLYGRNPGNYRVLDALATLAFDYPPRADFFRAELEQFLLLTRELAVDPLSIKGSYAGAIGIPQFMPGSIRRYAIDFSGDGKIDLAGNPADAIGSVANFLARHGWNLNLPVVWPASVAAGNAAAVQSMIDAGVKPQFKLPQLRASGVTIEAAGGMSSGASAAVPDDLALTLVDLPSRAAATEYRLGSENFFVITRYNRSTFYATAVADLAQELRGRHDAAAMDAK